MTSNVFRPFLTYLLPTMCYIFYPITSNIWGLFWTSLPTLKSDVIYQCSSSLFVRKDTRFLPGPKMTLAFRPMTKRFYSSYKNLYLPKNNLDRHSSQFIIKPVLTVFCIIFCCSIILVLFS